MVLRELAFNLRWYCDLSEVFDEKSATYLRGCDFYSGSTSFYIFGIEKRFGGRTGDL